MTVKFLQGHWEISEGLRNWEAFRWLKAGYVV